MKQSFEKIYDQFKHKYSCSYKDNIPRNFSLRIQNIEGEREGEDENKDDSIDDELLNNIDDLSYIHWFSIYHPDELEKLLLHKDNSEYINCRNNKKGWNALFLAVILSKKFKTEEGIDVLINYGIDVDTVDNEGNTILSIAVGNTIHYCSLKSIKLLLEAGSNPMFISAENVSILGKIQITLCCTSTFETLELVLEYCEDGFDSELFIGQEQDFCMKFTLLTTFFLGKKENSIKKLKYFLSKGIDINGKIIERLNAFSTILGFYPFDNLCEVFDICVEAGADLTYITTENENLLLMLFNNSVSIKNFDIVKKLIEAGNDPTRKNTDGDSALSLFLHKNCELLNIENLQILDYLFPVSDTEKNFKCFNGEIIMKFAEIDNNPKYYFELFKILSRHLFLDKLDIFLKNETSLINLFLNTSKNDNALDFVKFLTKEKDHDPTICLDNIEICFNNSHFETIDYILTEFPSITEKEETKLFLTKIEKMMKIVKNKILKKQYINENSACPICLTEFFTDPIFFKCGHPIHLNCLLSYNKTICPICRI